MVSFVHTSDWHLGMQAHFLPEEARARFAQDRFDAARRIALLAEEEKSAFVVVAGDIFDSNHVDRQVIARAHDALAAFVVPVFLLPGNHDPLNASSIYRTEAWTKGKPELVTVLEDAVAVPVRGVPGVEVVGLPWRGKHQLGDPAMPSYQAPPSSDGALRVVVAHGVASEMSPDSENPALIDSSELRGALQAGKAHYVALGDRHSLTEIPSSEGRAFYSGTPVATGHGEVDPNKALLVTLSEEACEVEPRDVGTWVFERSKRDLNSAEDVKDLADALASNSAKTTTVVKLGLRGTLSLSQTDQLEAILRENRHKFGSLEQWDAHTDLVVAPDEGDLSDLNVTGYVRETLDQLAIEARGSDEGAELAREALSLLYRLAR